MKPRIREVIVCEGRYDKNTLRQVVDATVLCTGGFQVFRDAELISLIRRAAETRGVILLTDSDGAGFVIRNYLKGALPKDRVRQAYIPDVYGKEKRKKVGGKEGKIGVEGMEKETILAALRRAGATFEEAETEETSNRKPLTKADMLDLGLIGAMSAAKRQALLRYLKLPEHMSANALLESLNLFYGREEVEDALRAAVGESEPS